MSSQQSQPNEDGSCGTKCQPRSAGGPPRRHSRQDQDRVKYEPRSAGAAPPRRHSDPEGDIVKTTRSDMIPVPESLLMTKAQRQEIDRKRTTKDNERAKAELSNAGILVRDFQIEADLEQSQIQLERAARRQLDREDTMERYRMEEQLKERHRIARIENKNKPMSNRMREYIEGWMSRIKN